MTEKAVSRDSLAERVPFFYGWVMVPIAMVAHICSSPGQTFGVSVFNPHMREALSLSQTELSGAYMLGTLLASLPMTYVGHLMDRFGPRRVLAGVAVLFGLACMGVSQVSGLFTLFLAFLFLRMLGQGSMSLLASGTVALWFNRRLGTVSGIMSLGMAVGMGGIPTMNLWLIDSLGWRWSYVVLGVGVWALVLPLVALIYRNRPEDVGQLPDGRQLEETSAQGETEAKPLVREPVFTLQQALHTRAYWIVAASVAFWSMSVTGIHFHSVQIFVDRGLTAAHAAAMFGVYAAAFAVLRFVGGVLADRVPLNGLLAVGHVGMAAGFALLNELSTPMSGHVFAGVLGGADGILIAVSTTLWVRYYGRRHLGKIIGSLATVGVASSSAGPLLMGTAHDLFGRYDESVWLFTAICIPLAIAGLLATPPRERDS